jgi:hypothetical protein
MLNTPVEFHRFKAIALYDAHRSVGQLFLQLADSNSLVLKHDAKAKCTVGQERLI